nr:aldehyde dehydrogenase family protein [Jeotgalicoccus pinnipedialis]
MNKSYINGAFVSGEGQSDFSNLNPFTDEIITTIRIASKEQTERAIEGAKIAQQEWAKLPRTRKKVMKNAYKLFNKNKNDIIDCLIKETGSTFIKAEVEFRMSMMILKESIKMVDNIGFVEEKAGLIPTKTNKIYRKPKGVISSISPFNFPFHLSMRTIAPALALGNTVVHKPDIQTGIVSGSVFAKIFHDAGLPSGVFQSILTKPSEIGDMLVEHEAVNLVSFTGSTEVGRHIGKIAGNQLKQAALELGGNSPFVVLKDADMKTAVRAAVMGTFFHQGQVCMSVNRIIVHADLYNQFVKQFVKATKRVKSGDPEKKRTLVGPIINKTQLDKTKTLIEKAKAAGTMALEGEQQGNVITPYIFTDISNDSEIAQTELFSPIALVIKAQSDNEALQMASDTKYGLSGSIITKNVTRGEKFAVEMASGMTHVNEMPVLDMPNIPFGGVKNSGIGRFGNPYVMDEFTELKWVSVQKKSLPYNWFS